MKTSLALLGCLMAPAFGEIVLWTASGTVDSATGNFDVPSLSADTPVSIRMTYDDRAIPDKPFNNFLGRVSTDYRTDIDLTIRVTIGEFQWEGNVTTGISGTANSLNIFPPPYTLVTDVKSSSSTESFTALLHSGDGATFSKFPFQIDEDLLRMNLDFKGPNTFLDGGIEVFDINHEFINTASGFIRMDDTVNETESLLNYTINPDSVSVINLKDEPFSPEIEFSTPGDDVVLNWRSDPRFSYRIEHTTNPEDAEWTNLESIDGTGAEISRTYSRTETTGFYRIITSTKSP